LEKKIMKKKQLGAFQAKKHFSEILAAVAVGEEFTITRHGKKIAMIIPFSEKEKESSAKGAIRAIQKLRAGITLGRKLSIKQMRTQGRK
jgi:prevent-host-death family protein